MAIESVRYDSEDAYSDSSSRSSTPSAKSDNGRKDKTRAIGDSLKSMGDRETDRANSIGSSIRPVQYRKGGKVRKTGLARLHKNERVIPAGKRKKVERLMKRNKIRMKGR